MPTVPPFLTALLVSIAGPSALASGPAPLVAEACVGCHGPGGAGAGSVPALAGRDAQEILALLLAFRRGERQATIMDRIARGYDEAELALAAEHFARGR